MRSSEAERAYYVMQSGISHAGTFAKAMDDLPRDIAALCAQIQALLIHRNWAPAYDVKLSDARMQEAHARSLPAILARVFELDALPLGRPRPPEARFAGTCRDFAMLLCASLRHQGIPARMRCGFGSYFEPERFVDHWVCERWDAQTGRWVLTDAQLDALQCEVLKPGFDPLYVPRDQFLVAGEAWRRCRSGEEDPEKFGIFDLRGLWFVRGNVMRDLAALNRVELLPWDDWGLLLELGSDREQTPEQSALVDRAASLARNPEGRLNEIREFYESEPQLRIHGEVRNTLAGRTDSLPS